MTSMEGLHRAGLVVPSVWRKRDLALEDLAGGAFGQGVDDPEIPSWEDGPRVGTTAPVPQPDSRFAPRWAVGLAVASIGVGAGATGLGCAAWLFFKGLSMVSVPGLERFAWIVIVSFGGLATAAAAIGGLISKAKQAAPPVINQVLIAHPRGEVCDSFGQ